MDTGFADLFGKKALRAFGNCARRTTQDRPLPRRAPSEPSPYREAAHSVGFCGFSLTSLRQIAIFAVIYLA
jgi:hypothetical protein